MFGNDYTYITVNEKMHFIFREGEITMTKQTTILILTLVLMAIGILYQIAIGVIYQRMIQQADTLSGTENKLLTQCKERFIQLLQA